MDLLDNLTQCLHNTHRTCPRTDSLCPTLYLILIAHSNVESYLDNSAIALDATDRSVRYIRCRARKLYFQGGQWR